MNLRIRCHGRVAPPAVLEYVERRFGFTLGRFADLIDEVAVTLRDENGPDRGGLDQRCRVELRLAGGRRLFAEALDGVLSAAVDRAAARAARRLTSLLEKERR